MDKEEIRTLIFKSKRSGIKLTTEEYTEALKYFRADEIEMMRWPYLDHSKCFSKDTAKIVSAEEALGN